jgi:hypothetical protein
MPWTGGLDARDDENGTDQKHRRILYRQQSQMHRRGEPCSGGSPFSRRRDDLRHGHSSIVDRAAERHWKKMRIVAPFGQV